MSKYTTEVRYICETAIGLKESVGYSKVDEVIDKAIPSVFDFDFPIFDERYRNILEHKILRHYYVVEIGMETVGLWKHFLNERLNLIMPYYNQLYKSELLEFNPLYDTDYTRTYNKKTEGNTKGTGKENREENGSNTTKDRYSDTPQGGLNGIESNQYLTNARITDNNGTTNSESKTENSGTYNNIDDYIEHVVGKVSSVNYSKVIQDFRKTFLNIDEMIINELSDLFMLVW